jgi:DNA-binding transcriptional regulator PaaX
MRPSDYLLWGLAVLSETADQMVGGGARAYHAGKLFVWTPPGYKKNCFDQTLFRRIKSKEIERVVVDGQVCFRLTQLGRRRWQKDFPLHRWQTESWDKQWTVIFFDIKETRRSLRFSLRTKLKQLGLGMLQQSCYISPYPIGPALRAYADEQGLREQIMIMRGPLSYSGDIKKLVYKVFNLGFYQEKYKNLLKETQQLKPDDRRGQRRVMSSYLEVVADDPALPKELLPADWQEKNLRKILLHLNV